MNPQGRPSPHLPESVCNSHFIALLEVLSDSVVQNEHGRQAAEQGKQCQHVSQAANGALSSFPLPAGGLLFLLDIPAATPSRWSLEISCSSLTEDIESRLSSLTGPQVQGWLAIHSKLCNA